MFSLIYRIPLAHFGQITVTSIASIHISIANESPVVKDLVKTIKMFSGLHLAVLLQKVEERLEYLKSQEAIFTCESAVSNFDISETQQKAVGGWESTVHSESSVVCYWAPWTGCDRNPKCQNIAVVTNDCTQNGRRYCHGSNKRIIRKTNSEIKKKSHI